MGSYKIVFEAKAQKQFNRLDKTIQRRIQSTLNEIAQLENPRSRGKMLTGNLSGYWRYRVGDYRIICDIVDSKIIIYILEIAHRREVYD